MNTDLYQVYKVYPETKLLRMPKKPTITSPMTSAQLRQHADELDAYEIELKTYTENSRKYSRLEGDLTSKFYEAAAKELGYENNPKRAKLEAVAWEEGHSSGLNEVFIWLEKLSDLIKD